MRRGWKWHLTLLRLSLVSGSSFESGKQKRCEDGQAATDVVHAFLLFVFVGLAENQRLVSNDLYFRSLADCVWYAQTLHRQGSNITAYCLPKLVPEGTRIYD